VLAQISLTQHFAPLEHPGADPRLGRDLAAVCPVSDTSRRALLALERQRARAVETGSGAAWTALGCVRARLAAEGALSHDGPLMNAGTSWEDGAIAALLRADEHSLDRRATIALAHLALDAADPPPLPVIAALMSRAAHDGITDPTVLRGCSDLDIRIDSIARARTCIDRALTLGVDSTWQLLDRARLDYLAADSMVGISDFAAAATAAHDSASREQVEWHLQWFISPEEWQSWNRLADSARGPWIRNALAGRDVRDGQPFGARLAEHFKRLEYVETHFRLHVPKMLRQSMATLPYATPDVDAQFLPSGRAVPGGQFRDYSRWQTDFDDRGVIWMRFGPPTNVADTLNPESDTEREAWLYDIDGQRFIVEFYDEDFDGSVGPSRLTIGMHGNWLCAIDTYRCRLAMLIEMLAGTDAATLADADVERLRDSDRVALQKAITSDDNSPRGERPMETVARLHRLWDMQSGGPFALVAYGLKESDLAVATSDTARTASVNLELRQWDPTAQQWYDTTIDRHWRLPDTSVRKPFVIGFLTAATGRSTDWSLVATQPGRRGRATQISTGGPLADHSLALSDLVLGAPDGLVWDNHGVSITVSPLGVFDRKALMSLYYQVRSDSARTHVTTTVAVYQVHHGVASDSASLRVAFTGSVPAGLSDVNPQIDLSHLDPGPYLLEVQLDDGHGAAVRRNAPLTLH
jgi:hypothetical protein